MHGVVFAAGEGTRLRPLTADKPKGLVEVAGRPILTHCFETLVALGVDELVVVVGYRKDDIIEHYGDQFRDVPVSYAHQAEQNGLAHALLAAEQYVDGDFLAMNGDNVIEADLAPLVTTHEESGAVATLLTDIVSLDRAAAGGVFELDDDGAVVGLVEKPDTAPSRKIPRGVYAFSPRIFHACHLVEPSGTGEYELADAIDLLLYAGAPVALVELDGWCLNVNTAVDRDEADRRLTEQE
jgi:glucose-1-phosphate thymidylyltransferase